jgi:hypothetical protein
MKTSNQIVGELSPISETSMGDIDGGVIVISAAFGPIGIVAGLTATLIKTIEANPSSYTWLMDWYYAPATESQAYEGPYSILNRQ